MNDRRQFKLTATEGRVRISVDGELIEETFDLSPSRDLVFFLRSANLLPDDIKRILSELSTKGSSQFFLD